MPILPACAALAVTAYHVPSTTLETVATHASPDGIGVMGIQPGWLPILAKAGFDPDRVRRDICMNVAAGAWIIAWADQKKKRAPDKPEPATPVPSVRSSTPPGRLGTCIADAAHRYRLPLLLFEAVLKTEGGKVGSISKNHNGSYDMGPAQINSAHLPELNRMGIARDQVINDGCLNIHIGAWILARALQGQGTDNPAEFWRRVGNYNSATPVHNRAYQAKVWENVRAMSHSQTTRAD